LCRWGFYPFYVAQPFVERDIDTRMLADKINPNTATWASLARLPGIGITRARAIVEYREKAKASGGNKGIVFSCCGDLTKIKGIGPVTVKKIEEYLVFRDPNPAGPGAK